jgi:serine/threonine protein kinase
MDLSSRNISNALHVKQSSPIPFPNPLLHKCDVKICNILTVEGVFYEKTIITSTGHYYEIGELIRNAMFGFVAHGFILKKEENGSFTRTNQEVAIKAYDRKYMKDTNPATSQSILGEIAAMQFIGSDQVHLMGQIECVYNHFLIYNIMPFCPGYELFDYIDNYGPLDNIQGRKFMKQTIHGLQHLHSRGIAHLDISLENILYNPDNDEYVIIDYGTAIRLNYSKIEGKYCAVPKLNIRGKRTYMPPEMLRGDANINPLYCDIWSLGITLFMALSAKLPLGLASPLDEGYNYISAGKLIELVEKVNVVDIDDQALDLIQSMLRPIGEDRISLEEILNHPWMLEDE